MKINRRRWLAISFLSVLFMVTVIGTEVMAKERELQAIQGKFDVQQQLIEQVGPFELKGEWEFYWQELLTPVDFMSNTVPYSFSITTVPYTWHKYILNGEKVPKYGYATYRLSILLAEQDVGKLYSLYIPSVATAYKLWVNDNFLGGNGVVAAYKEEMIPQNYARMFSFIADSQKVDIVIQVSNFHQRKSGLWESISFGTVEQITRLRERNILYQAFVVGCIVIIGFYQLVLYFQRPKDISPFYLAIACFGVALRTLLLKDALIVYLFPQFNWEIAVTLEYLSGLIALLFFLLFIRKELSLDMPIVLIRTYMFLVSSYGIFVLVTPAKVFTNTFLFYQLLAFTMMLSIVVVTFLGILRKREGACLNFLVMLVLFAVILNDILYYSHIISTDEFVSIGLLCYLFIQSVHLARRFSRSFDHVENLSMELKELNQSLERKVEMRTQALRKANTRLQKIEQARRRLLASVSHELMTPLTFIQGYTKAMMDGVISRDDSSYLRAVYSDTQMMAHLVQDLQELSKLESGQVSFKFEYVDIREYLNRLYEEQKPIVNETGVVFKYEEQLELQKEDEPIYCLIDPLRMKQVYINLVMNAQKFTPIGGTITVQLNVSESFDAEKVSICVQDSGLGIPEKDLPFIFERFYKVNQQEHSGKPRGAGLGLAIVKEIVEYHQGTITVTSQPGKGSTFCIYLPMERFHLLEEVKAE